MLAILGLVAQHLRFGTPFRATANEGVLPFYILHQTVPLTVGYLVVRWAAPDLAKWVFMAASSLAICIGLYWLVIRPIDALRFLFGMKPRGGQIVR